MLHHGLAILGTGFLLIESLGEHLIPHLPVCQQQTHQRVLAGPKAQRVIIDNHNPLLIVIADIHSPDELAMFQHGSHSLLRRKRHLPASPIPCGPLLTHPRTIGTQLLSSDKREFCPSPSSLSHAIARTVIASKRCVGSAKHALRAYFALPTSKGCIARAGEHAGKQRFSKRRFSGNGAESLTNLR